MITYISESDLLCKTEMSVKISYEMDGWMIGTDCPQPEYAVRMSHGSHQGITCLKVKPFSLGYQMSFPRPF